MRELLITLTCLWAMPFLAQNVPETNNTAPVNTSNQVAIHQQNMVVDAYFKNEEKKLVTKKAPGIEEVIISVPAASEGFIIFKKEDDGTIQTSYVGGKKALFYAKNYVKNKGAAETDENQQNEKAISETETAPVQTAVSIIKNSIKLGKNLQSRYEMYKKGDRKERFALVKELIFGSPNKEKTVESVPEDWRIKLFTNPKTELLEVYANVTGLEIFVLDEEGNALLKAGEVQQAFTELNPSDWPKEGRWLQFVKDGRVRVMKF